MKITIKELRELIKEVGVKSLHGKSRAPSPGGKTPFEDLKIWFGPAGINYPDDLIAVLKDNGAEEVARDLIDVLAGHVSRQ